MSIYDPIRKLPKPVLIAIAVAVTIVVIYAAMRYFAPPTICDPVHIPTPTPTQPPMLYDPVHRPPV